MAPTVVIAYPGFGDIRIEEEILSTIDANVSHLGNTDTPASREVVAQADALMVTLQPVPAELIATMERCRIVSRVGTGLDAIDIDAATKHGIWVTYVPDYAVDEVSTHAIASLLAHARGFPRLLESTRRGEWGNKVVAPIHRLQGQTLGVVGYGRIGRAVGVKAHGLGLEVNVHDPYLDSLPARFLLCAIGGLGDAVAHVGLCLSSRAANGWNTSHHQCRIAVTDEIDGVPDQHGSRRTD